MRTVGAVMVLAVILGSCATLPTLNPDNVAEDQLVDVNVATTDREDIDSSWAIVAINGMQLDQALETGVIESAGSSDTNGGVILPVGTHDFTIKLARGFVGSRMLYHDQELDVRFTFDEPGAGYRLARESSPLRLGYTVIVLSKDSSIPVLGAMIGAKVDEAEIELVGNNEWAVRQ